MHGVEVMAVEDDVEIGRERLVDDFGDPRQPGRVERVRGLRIALVHPPHGQAHGVEPGGADAGEVGRVDALAAPAALPLGLEVIAEVDAGPDGERLGGLDRRGEQRGDRREGWAERRHARGVSVKTSVSRGATRRSNGPAVVPSAAPVQAFSIA